MIDIQKNFSLKESNSLAFDHRVEYYCDAETLEDCQEFIEFCLKKNIPINLLGEGTNIVLTKNIEGGVLKVSIPGRIKEENIVNFGAGENWNETVLWSLENQLFGLENLVLINLENVSTFFKSDIKEVAKACSRGTMSQRFMVPLNQRKNIIRRFIQSQMI